MKKIHNYYSDYDSNFLRKDLTKSLSEMSDVLYTNSNKLEIVTNIPEDLNKHLSLEERLNKLIRPFNRSFSSPNQFALRDPRPFAWEKRESKLVLPPRLPTRLYNITKGKENLKIVDKKTLEQDIELTQEHPEIKQYATLSYVWGYQREDKEVSPNARKALNKVIEALEFIINQDKVEPINHLWIDQLCIKQEGKESIVDKKREVPLMKQYYSNSSITFIAIDNNIGKIVKNKWGSETELVEHIIRQILTSSWFKRSWTFQEGLLSKQTIFLFDDGVVDGRILAYFWGDRINNSIIKSPAVYVTPLGWSYGAKKDHSVDLGLSQALDAVKHRQQIVALDGIYSILGLLPYGHLVETNYQPRTCPQCPNEKEVENCQHDEINKKWHQYTKEELNTELMKVMKLAIDNNYPYEPFSWLGSRHIDPKYWMIPCIPHISAGISSNITGFTNFTNFKKSEIKISKQGWEFIGKKQIVGKGVKIHLCDDFFGSRFTRSLTIILPLSKKATRSIVFKNCNETHIERETKFFLDMFNKELVMGEVLINQYHQQLPKIIEKFNQPFNLLYDKDGNNETFNNSLVWEIGQRFYIVNDNQYHEIELDQRNQWQYKQQYQTQQLQYPQGWNR